MGPPRLREWLGEVCGVDVCGGSWGGSLATHARFPADRCRLTAQKEPGCPSRWGLPVVGFSGVLPRLDLTDPTIQRGAETGGGEAQCWNGRQERPIMRSWEDL